MANGAGKVTLGQSFDPFGSPLVRKGFDSSRYGYTGEWTDGSGLQYLRARYYSPAMGRFLSPIPSLDCRPSRPPKTHMPMQPIILSCWRIRVANSFPS